MSTSTFSIFSSSFGFVVAAISLFALFVNIYQSRRPHDRIKKLASLMDETETHLIKAVEEGRSKEPGFVQLIERHLIVMMKTLTDHLEPRARDATTLRQNCPEFLRVTSESIGGACRSLESLRAQVIGSEMGPGTLMEMSSVPQSPPSPTLPRTPDPACHPNPLRSTRIVRPRSCPSVLSGWRLDGFAQGNPFSNPTQSDSDVRTTDVQNSTSFIHTSVTLEPGA